jgi:uncharacterized protein YutE (UPF0331/DUF86 family)
MTLDVDVVRGRCQEIEQSLTRLEAISAAGREAFLTDADAIDIGCYRLLIAIEAALALCYHVSARRLRSVADDYAECFEGLERGGIIPADLSAWLQQMARFRNLLVHVYWKLDYGRVFDVIEQDLEDLRRFSQSVAALVSRVSNAAVLRSSQDSRHRCSSFGQLTMTVIGTSLASATGSLSRKRWPSAVTS